MMKKAILVAIAIALTVVLAVTTGRRDAPPAGDGAFRADENQTATVGAPSADVSAAPSHRDRSSATTPGEVQPPVGPISNRKPMYRRGTLLRADSQPAAGVVYWIWGDTRPPWTELHPGILDTPTPSLSEPAGITDHQGAWAVGAGLADPQASRSPSTRASWSRSG